MTAPRVVIFRPMSLDQDTRAKKIALTLARAGYQAIILSACGPGSDPGSDPGEYALGPVRVVTVAPSTRARDLHRARLIARRRRMPRLVDWTPRDEHLTRVAELRRAAAASASPVVHARLLVRRGRRGVQRRLDAAVRRAWQFWDAQRVLTARLATDRGTLPELEDYADSFGPVLDRLAPDVIHVHHPLVLPLVIRAARRARAGGLACAVVYDVREDYAGIPAGEQGNPRRHAVLLRQEARSIADVTAVITVSDPIAAQLQSRYDLLTRPTVVLNAPPRPVPGGGQPTTSLRDRLALDPDTPLLVYSGGMSRARGTEVLVDALPALPGAHLVLITVPYPHPLTPALLDRAAALGVGDRLHVLPPVGQDELLDLLASADVGLHPLPGGSPNHDQALPNKLFEYLHAGLPLVVSDARLMADFVRSHDLGEVFRSGDAADLALAVGRVLARRGEPRAPRDDLAARYCWQAQEPLLLEVYAAVAPLPSPLRRDPTSLPERFPDLEVTVR